MYHFFMATPSGLVFEGEVVGVNLPGAVGYFETLTSHAPILSLIKPGKVGITDAEKRVTTYAVGKGYFEMSHNKATLLVDEAKPLV